MAKHTTLTSGVTLWELVADLIQSYLPHAGSTATAESIEWKKADQIRGSLHTFASNTVPSDRWKTKASVGQGNWVHAPWAAVFDTRETDRASRGAFVVLRMICDGTPGLLLGFGLSNEQFEDHLKEKAAEAATILTQIDGVHRAALKRLGLIERPHNPHSSGPHDLPAKDEKYGTGMVFDTFVPSAQITQARRADLDQQLAALIKMYHSWTSRPGFTPTKTP